MFTCQDKDHVGTNQGLLHQPTDGVQPTLLLRPLVYTRLMVNTIILVERVF